MIWDILDSAIEGVLAFGAMVCEAVLTGFVAFVFVGTAFGCAVGALAVLAWIGGGGW